jgi:hypothetical protein
MKVFLNQQIHKNENSIGKIVHFDMEYHHHRKVQLKLFYAFLGKKHLHKSNPYLSLKLSENSDENFLYKSIEDDQNDN